MVEIVKEEVEVTKEINELGVAIKKVLQVAVKALEDGWQPGTDIPSVLMGSFNELIKGIDGIDKMGEEAKQESIKAAMGALIPVAEGIEILLERKKPVVRKANVVGNEKPAQK